MPTATESIQIPARASRIGTRLVDLFARLLGIASRDVDVSRTFVDQGFDSLLLMQASRSIEAELGVHVPFRRLLEGLATIEDLSQHLDRELPVDADVPGISSPGPHSSPSDVPAAPQVQPQIQQPVSIAAVSIAPVSIASAQQMSASHASALAQPARASHAPPSPARGIDMQAIVAQQLAIMQAQLEVLRGGLRQPRQAATPTPTATATEPSAPSAPSEPEPLVSHGPYRPVRQTISQGAEFTARQTRYYEEFVRRYTERTRRSKAYAAERRSTLADNRAALGFRMATKELVYPIVGERSQGSRLWDLDGNEYIDFTMGFGVHFFGHRPPFVVEAVEEQLRRGFHVGPQSDLAGPAAELIRELTGMERVTFCNTGSEAIMTALRIARAKTGRDRIAIFEDSYHGMFDGVLARRRGTHGGTPVSLPVAPGIPQRMVDDIVVLPYGSAEALEWLTANMASLAAVLVEPEQSRHLEVRPREFLQEVRSLTARHGTVLIFDEIITGFRLGVRGAQGLYGIDADLATYGKVIGGGFPLGVIAGRAALMDTIDGGMWSFGDDSFPAANQTFFAGTFCKHPVAMAAACAVLRHIQQRGPSLYDEVERRAARLVAALRAVILEEAVPIRLETSASRFSFRVDPQEPFAHLLFAHLLERGMYIWEGRGCFLSTVHTDEDCERLVSAFRESIHALRDGGFLPERPERSVARDEAPRSLPLTPAQRQVWVHAQLGDDASRAYNEQIVFGLRGHFDVAVMRAALDDVMRHHEGLRTIFDRSGETQHIVQSLPVGLPVALVVSDALSAPGSDADTEARTLREAARETFDLASGPLLRVVIYPRGPEYHVVQIVYHHIAMDALAFMVVLRDLEAAYRARRDGQTPQLPPSMQLSEYVVRLAQHASAHADREADWLRHFEDATPLIVPTDRPRPLLPAGTAATAKVALPAALTTALRALSRREGCTLFMTLFAGVLALLHRIADQEDIVTGISAAGRPFAGAESVVAHCVDILPIRSRIERAQRARPFLKAVRGWLLDAYDREVFSLARLTDRLKIARGPGLPPLVSVTFNLEPRSEASGGKPARFADLTREAAGARELFARFDLHIDALELDDRIDLVCRYNADLFERDTIERMLERLTRVLEQIASTPEIPLAQLDLLADTERRLVVDEWNRTGVDAPADRCVHHLFEAQAQRMPEATAVICEDRQLTYRELNERANQLAHHLRRHGVGPDAVAGMYFDRSVEAIVALLGILKAGGAYLPLDPALPQERLGYMLQAARSTVVVTRRSMADAVPADGAKVICLDEESLRQEALENPPRLAAPEHLAYVMFTSGSTGRPKGVGIEHRQLANYVCGIKDRLGLTAGTRYATVSTLSADLGNTVVFPALAGGGCLHVISEARLFSGEALAAYFQQHEIDCLKITPSHFAALQQGTDPARVMPRRWLVLGGEASSLSWVDQLLRLAPDCAIFNHYGPTEATVGVLTFRVTSTRPASGSSTLVLGQPLPNTRVFVLDRHLQPVPIGAPGELCIGGAQVGRGYVGQPGLTAERFIPDPFTAEPGARLYRTGDRARWRADGTVEFLGRVDRQVKIRGIRVELGEVEATLRRHEGVRACTVVMREDPPAEPRLVAYVVGDVTTEALRADVQRSLPEVMVPSAFVVLDALPLTRNGKIDDKALPAPDVAAAEDHMVAARTPVEEVLTGILAELLGLERVGVDDNFFALGGHSLLAMRAVMRIREAFGVELPVGAFFEAPTAAALATAIEKLVDAGASRLPPVVPVARTTALPASFAQERLWFLDRLKPAGNAYNLHTVRRISGELHVRALEQTLGEIVRRHEILRTTLAEVDGAAVQVIAPFDGFALRVEDLSALDEATRDTEVARRVREEAVRAVDLAAGPLFRSLLFRLRADEHVLLLCMHHVVTDGWSLDVLFRELSVLYAAFSEGRESPLPELPVQYADYAVWQRLQLQGDVLAEQLAWWRRQLAGAPELIALPTDRPRPPVQSDRGARELVELPWALQERLEALARREGATLYMVLLSAFQVLLAGYSGSDDVVVGSPIAGRTREEIAPLIGFFVNTLALRTDLSGDPAFRDVLRRVRQITLGAYQHQDLPFEQLVAELQPQRSMNHSPIFQVMFSLHEVGGMALSLPGLRLHPVPGGEIESTKFDLIFEAFVDRARLGGDGARPAAPQRGLRVALTYRTDLFEQPTIQRMLTHLTRVLEQVARDVDVRLSKMSLLDDKERAQVVDEWNATTAAYPDSLCVHELFEAQAAKTPRATAVMFEGVRLEYSQLNRRANQLAHHLRACGVGPDVPVAICMERSFEMVVGLFAILKAGGAYVPLDPTYPADRLQAMLADSAPMAVLTHAATRGRFADLAVPCVDLTAPGPSGPLPAWTVQPSNNPARGALTPDHLCYVIYTSGSTGRPKGVMNQHRCVVNRLAWGQTAWELRDGDAILGHTSLTFDGSLRELFWPLSVGARVVLARPEGHRDPDYLLELIRAEQISTISLVPSVLQLLLDHPQAADAAGLRQVMCGGDVLPGALLQRFHERWPRTQFHQMYGPSEAATAIVAVRCPLPPVGTLSLGRPIANVRIYILDGAGRPVPVGVVGELFIGGVGVARGYLTRAGLTAERFVPDPFSGTSGARLYRTGDLGSWRPDGTIAFAGRNDFQVKVRGFRIELGEIEAALHGQAGVSACVVVARDEGAGDRRLVAYYVGADSLDPKGLRASLSARLPEYMIPAAYVRLETLPLTPTGKVDRKALPAPDSDSYVTHKYEEPRDEIERAVAEIWAEVLDLERVGRWDHFFELGGHSLRAVQVISRVRQVLAVDVALRELFLQPVLAEFARGLHQAARSALPPIEPVARTERLPLSFAQQRLWFVEQMGRTGPAYHISRRLRLKGPLDRVALKRALDRLVQRHESLRTIFEKVDGEPVQRITPGDASSFLLREHNLQAHADVQAELDRLVEAETSALFDLAQGPLIRGRLIRLADDDHVFLITMHHIVSDGWSMGVFVAELGALYAAFHRGDEDPLPPLAIQYADYAAWQRRWIEGDGLAPHLGHWQQALAGAPELLALPTDHPRPAQQDFAGGGVRLVLNEDLTAALKRLSQRHGTTLFMTLVTAWAVVLGRLSRQRDVVIGTPTANRGRRELEGLIGFFINTLPLRIDLSGAPTIPELLARVKAAVLDFQQYQELPFERIVELVRPARSLAHSPLFQVVFAWQNIPRRRLELEGLTWEATDAPHVTAKYDQSLMMLETGRRIEGELSYATALFERETAERHLAYLRRVLDGMVADDRQPIEHLQLMDAAERAQVVEVWNLTARPYPRGRCVHELFETQVRRAPEALALIWEQQALTYRELDARANRLARHLRRLGAGPEARIALYLDRGVDLIVAMLGVLKAGGCYVPLDPGYPADRLAYMLNDTGVAVLLTQAGVPETLPVPDRVKVLALDHQAAAIAAERADAPASGVTPDNLAYIVYTSGSTGRPKGVMIGHRNIVQLVCETDYVDLRPGDRVAQASNANFDALTFEAWGALLNGATLVGIPKDVLLSPTALREVLRTARVTTLFQTTALFNQLSREFPDIFATLREALFGGQAVDAESVRRVLGGGRPQRLLHVYGPTETTAWCTWEEVEEVGQDARTVPIGQPVGNARLYVLDAALQPVPIGVPGEGYVGGAGVGRGYWGRPSLTAERFIPDRFADEPGARLYRTGDMLRWLADGRLEFVGRIDAQLKIRGFRIEPGEIEAALATHPAVREARVVPRAGAAAEEPRLVAYVVGETDGDALRAHLRQSLPEYLIPAAFVMLDHLPLTPTGKLDMTALPAPDFRGTADEYGAPRTAIEERLVEIWADVLQLDRIGATDNFFELGGHSLMVMRLTAQIRAAFGIDLSFRTVFSLPTLRPMAEEIERGIHADILAMPEAEAERLAALDAQEG